jgi:ParB-like chromosome segregation protein Spo0J
MARKRPSAVGVVETSFVQVADLTPYARNARTHSPEQVDQLAKLIEKFGWTTPLLVDEDGGLIAGHGRVMAAAKIYAAGGAIRMASGESVPAGSLPVNYARGWSEADKRAYILADNKVALNSGWDTELLKVELEALKAIDFDLALTGFTLPEIDLTISGWDIGADPRDKNGSHLDGIAVTLKFHVAKDVAVSAKALCVAALKGGGIAYEE